jgi:hypothetical protein
MISYHITAKKAMTKVNTNCKNESGASFKKPATGVYSIRINAKKVPTVIAHIILSRTSRFKD